MKKSLCLTLVIILSLFLFSTQSSAHKNQSTIQIDNMSITQLPWDKDGCGIHYVLEFTVANSIVKNIYVGDTLYTVNTESEILKDRSCKITVDDGRVFTPGYTDYYAGWSEKVLATARGVHTGGTFKQNIPEGITAGHKISVEVYQRATTTGELLKPQILLADVENPGDGYARYLVYGFVVGANKIGESAKYMDEPFPATIKEDVIVIAEKTTSTILVDGNAVSFNAYNINGNNYFKLRDVAYVLSETNKQFDVAWENNCIKLLPMKKYTIIGGEMTSSNEQFKNAKVSNDVTIVHEKGYGLNAELFKDVYNIDDNNYFKLRDIGQYFDFNVTWDGVNNCILIDSTTSYIDK